jgi:hypothetical protein
MQDRWKSVTYFAVKLPNRPGELARLADRLHAENLDLLGLWGHAAGDDSPLISVVPKIADAFRNFAGKAGLEFDEGRAVYLKGTDKPGALVETLDRIAGVGINIDAVECVSSGDAFGWFLWPTPGQQEALDDLLL